MDFLWLLLALTLVRGVIYAVLNPLPFGSPDEPDHFQYVKTLATQGLSAPRGAEGNQPIPYYALMVPVYWLTAGHSLAVQSLSIRLASLPFLLGIVLFTWAAGNKMAPNRPFVAIAATGFVAFHPQLAYIGASANNDNAANLMAAVLTYLIVSLISEKPHRWTLPATVLAIGAALMTKGQILPTVGIATVTLIAYGIRHFSLRSRPLLLLGALPLAAAVALVLMTREGAFMMSTSSTILAFAGNGTEALGIVRDTGFDPVPYLFLSFWSAFVGESVHPQLLWYVGPTAIVALAPAAYLARAIRSHDLRRLIFQRRSLLLIALTAVILGQFLTVYLRYLYGYTSLTQDWKLQVLQGRFLFASLPSFGLLVALGWDLGLGEQRWRVGALAIAALLFALDAASLAALLGSHSWSTLAVA